MLDLGTVGVRLLGDTGGGRPGERDLLRGIERLGYGSAWFPEGIGGHDVFARSGIALAATERLAVGTGIANLWARPAPTAQAGGRALAEGYPRRFVLGIGVGHPFQAAQVGEKFTTPLTRLRNYLSRMDEEAAVNPPAAPFPRVIAALGPRMLELAREAADGAHTFFAPPEHTAFAREILGPDKLLVVHQPVLLDSDPSGARATAREMVALVLGNGPYARPWRDFGHDPGRLDDRLVDAAVAWGDEEAIARRVRRQLDAGADHVLISPLTQEPAHAARDLARLAPALTGGARETPVKEKTC
ncbi:TIGR03620 family F420-dependent LLM class oxidoreductase [Amycolatopsis cynarae]|uniref:TIGR03620 family F420-dependent LLM class oxidoreductase n=1 Tax=Amycolatopsis cynarae TaxID=2995223 RepID=A0ABY7AWE9_9PSEU|nr:TIGR03620 family F420-dependent LLM class oxidoreductase [Amycolatopsis sp. HUAS 11-8]WAL64335.1 TIGR03620 family F420-dependent LLM class oxidoreductase [Amycolatopsis sp. HUAS 11-8]